MQASREGMYALQAILGWPGALPSGTNSAAMYEFTGDAMVYAPIIIVRSNHTAYWMTSRKGSGHPKLNLQPRSRLGCDIGHSCPP